MDNNVHTYTVRPEFFFIYRNPFFYDSTKPRERERGRHTLTGIRLSERKTEMVGCGGLVSRDGFGREKERENAHDDERENTAAKH